MEVGFLRGFVEQGSSAGPAAKIENRSGEVKILVVKIRVFVVKCGSAVSRQEALEMLAEICLYWLVGYG